MVLCYDHPLHDLLVGHGIADCLPYMAWRFMVDVLRLDPDRLPDLCDDIDNLVKQYIVEWILDHYDEFNEHWYVLCHILPNGLLPPRLRGACAVLAIAERAAPAAAREIASTRLDGLVAE